MEGPAGASLAHPAPQIGLEYFSVFMCVDHFFTAMISTPAQICGERQGWEKSNVNLAVTYLLLFTLIRAQTLLLALVTEILKP